MTPIKCAIALRSYNKWRRWDGEPEEKSPPMPHPRELGIAIDAAIELVLKGIDTENGRQTALERAVSAETQRDELMSAIKPLLAFAIAQLKSDGFPVCADLLEWAEINLGYLPDELSFMDILRNGYDAIAKVQS